jgi:transglutaminase-like putative cysteine protease
MVLKVRHRTVYRYAHPVALSHNQVVSEPRETPSQKLLSNQLDIEPAPNYTSRRRDVFGNWLTYFTLEEPHRELSIVTRSEVEVTPAERPVPSKRDEFSALQFRYASPLVPTLPELASYAQGSFAPERPLLESLQELNSRIHADFEYRPGSTDITTPLPQVLISRRGVCQDFAHLLVGMARSLGLSARYVSGYLLTNPPPGKARLVGADASHAWASVFLPSTGWVDFDPTNNMLCGDSHVTQAWGRDYHDVSPVRGVVLGGGKQTVGVYVDVLPG